MRRLFIISAALFGIAVIVLAIRSERIRRPILEKRAMMQECEDYIQNSLPEDLKEYYKGFPVDGEFEITCTPERKTTYDRGYGGAYWKDVLTVRLNTAESFEELTDRERYNMLQELMKIGSSNWKQLIIERYPWYSDPEELVESAYEKTFFLGQEWEEEFSIKTPANRYIYVPDRDCYKVDNGKMIITYQLKDPESIYYNAPGDSIRPTASPTPYPYATYKPTPKPTNEPDRTDPWEAHLFDDPDEYADYYAEDYADEYEEDIDDAYLDAYDHWVEWHEDY